MKYVVEVCDRGPETLGRYEVEVNRLGVVTDYQPTELPADELAGWPVVGRLAPDLERDLLTLFDRADIVKEEGLIALRINERLWGTISVGSLAYITVYDEALMTFSGPTVRKAMDRLVNYYSGITSPGETGDPFA